MWIIAASLILFFSFSTDALVLEGAGTRNPMPDGDGNVEAVNADQRAAPAPIGTMAFDGSFDWRISY